MITTTYNTDKTIVAMGKAVEIPITVASGQTLVKGQAVGRVTATGKYKAYSNANSDGTEVCSGIISSDCDASSTGFNRDMVASMIIGVEGGALYTDKLTNVDAAALADLGARSVPGRNLTIIPI